MTKAPSTPKKDHPWYRHYGDLIPHHIDPDRFASLGEAFSHHVSLYADAPAFTNLGTTLTYRELDRLSAYFAGYLQSLGLERGDRVAIMLPNLLQYPVIMMGVLRAGFVVVNLNPLYTAGEIAAQLKDAAPKVIAAIANYADVLGEALKTYAVSHVVITEVGDLLSWAKGWVVNGILRYFKRLVPKHEIAHAVSFKSALKQGRSHGLSAVTLTGADIAFLQYTGGTTGTSKGAVLTHRNLLANMAQCSNWMQFGMKKNKDRVVGALPLYHIFSLTVCCLTFMSLGAECVLITNPRDLDRFVKTLRKYPPTVFIGLNTLFNALLNHKHFHKVDFSRLHTTIAGGMAMQSTVAEKWKKVTGVVVTEGYGLTEASPVVTINPIFNHCYNGSIGLPIPSTEVVIRNEAGEEVPFSEPGELCVRGPQVMRGYWRRPEETANVLDQEGWLKTGDIACMDSDGFIYIVDRKKDMVLISGFNVYPNEVEEVIASCPGVLEVAVIGVPNEKTGEMLKACIVKKDPLLTESVVLRFCAKKLTRYKIPKRIEFLDHLPKTNVGKILRRALRAEG